MAASISPLAAYRQLLRATRIAFDGDLHTLLAARAEARKHFEQNRQSRIDTQLQIQHALETARILRTNIVQGVRSEKDGEERYSLRIHDEIERGDNESIKKGGAGVEGGKCCSS